MFSHLKPCYCCMGLLVIEETNCFLILQYPKSLLTPNILFVQQYKGFMLSRARSQYQNTKSHLEENPGKFSSFLYKTSDLKPQHCCMKLIVIENAYCFLTLQCPKFLLTPNFRIVEQYKGFMLSRARSHYQNTTSHFGGKWGVICNVFSFEAMLVLHGAVCY